MFCIVGDVVNIYIFFIDFWGNCLLWKLIYDCCGSKWVFFGVDCGYFGFWNFFCLVIEIVIYFLFIILFDGCFILVIEIFIFLIYFIKVWEILLDMIMNGVVICKR